LARARSGSWQDRSKEFLLTYKVARQALPLPQFSDLICWNLRYSLPFLYYVKKRFFN
jgi:hypothetical protein